MDMHVTGKLIGTPRGQARIYRLNTPRVNERTVRALARRFGMRAEKQFGALRSDEDKLTYTEGHFELTVYRASGALRFIDRARWQVDDRQSDLKMEDAEARRIAQRWVRKLKLAPSGQTKFLKAARLRVGEATADGKEATERTIDVAVALQRWVDRIPVDGPGGKIVVYLDHEGKPTGVERIWRETAGVHRRGASYRSPQEAINEMAEHYRSKRGVIEVQEARFGYFEEGRRSRQRYLQPAYVIVGVIGSSDSAVRKRAIYVAPALANAVGRITPPLERKPPQRPRTEAK